jgi:hypothetical protein
MWLVRSKTEERERWRCDFFRWSDSAGDFSREREHNACSDDFIDPICGFGAVTYAGDEACKCYLARRRVPCRQSRIERSSPSSGKGFKTLPNPAKPCQNMPTNMSPAAVPGRWTQKRAQKCPNRPKKYHEGQVQRVCGGARSSASIGCVAKSPGMYSNPARGLIVIRLFMPTQCRA